MRFLREDRSSIGGKALRIQGDVGVVPAVRSAARIGSVLTSIIIDCVHPSSSIVQLTTSQKPRRAASLQPLR